MWIYQEKTENVLTRYQFKSDVIQHTCTKFRDNLDTELIKAISSMLHTGETFSLVGFFSVANLMTIYYTHCLAQDLKHLLIHPSTLFSHRHCYKPIRRLSIPATIHEKCTEVCKARKRKNTQSLGEPKRPCTWIFVQHLFSPARSELPRVGSSDLQGWIHKR